MSRFLVPALTGLFLALPAVPAQAGFIAFQVLNFTLSGGDATYPITSDVTFNNLSLTETFRDDSRATVPLRDFGGVVRTTLDTNQLALESAPILATGGARGDLISTTLTGTFSVTDIQFTPTFGGPRTSVTVLPTFSATLTGFSPDAVLIVARGPGGATYGAGALSILATAVPEPSSLALMIVGAGVGLLTVGPRRVRRPRTSPSRAG